jgi:hypothetical protein
MAAAIPYFDQYAIDNLKVKLSEKLGYAIMTKPDCAALSEKLKSSEYGYVSESTIYRLFFQPYAHAPYKNTLDVLCRFAGFNSSVEFYESQMTVREELHKSGINTYDKGVNSLLFYCIENSANKPMLDFFENIDPAADAFKESMRLAMFDSLVKASRPRNFFKAFSHQRYIREYFFEKGHDPLFRIKDYDLGYKYYLERLDIGKSISQFQDYVFGNCVLFRYYYVNNRFEYAASAANSLYRQEINRERLRKELYIFPYIRFISYKLWYLEMTGAQESTLEDYANFLLELCSELKPGLDKLERNIVFYTIAETFLHSNRSESHHWKIKKIFEKDYRRLPEAIYSKHLKYSLPYFECNGMLVQRP